MRFARTNTGRPAWSRWHKMRELARLTAVREDEFSEAEQSDFTIDEDDETYPLGGLPAGENVDTWRVEDPVTGEVYDVRKEDPRIGRAND